MCGIAGLIGTASPSEAEVAVCAMVATLERRGPDGRGVESWSSAVLGHRRLSIFDLSEAGSQPMVSADRSLGVVFNGAIYNFQDLRRDLIGRGYRFRSRTDTEVLIHGYDCYGIDGLVSKLRGMFAFGLWDDRHRKCFLVRDRLGVKPLVYTVWRGQLAFASGVRALRHAGLVSEINPDAVSDYLEFGYVSDARAIYRDAKKVPAATILEWSAGVITQREYWKPPAVSEHQPAFHECVDRTEHLLLEAVKMRLEADVPVGALLSGGIDSSLVCWAIAKLGGNVKAFTVATPGDPADESKDASATAARLGLDHSIIDVNLQDSPDPAELVTAFDEPFACSSALGMLRVSQAVKPHATVLLTGDGGDDCFLGYPEHKHFYLAQRMAPWIPSVAGRHWPQWRSVLPKSGPAKRAASLIDYATGGLGAVARAHDGLPFYQMRGLLGERLERAAVAHREIPRSPASARRLMADFLVYDRETRFVGEYMTKVDGATMHYALEARAPFLDHELWSYASTLDYTIRLRGGKLKAVLRELARRHLGERVAAGRKRGFTIPVGRWLAGGWRTRLERDLDGSILARDGWIRSAALRRAIEAMEEPAPNQIWYLLILENWMRYEQGVTAEPGWDPSVVPGRSLA